jgi:cytochrome c peroxidase
VSAFPGRFAAGIGGAAVIALAFSLLGAATPRAEWRWDLPPGFPAPRVPADNPMSEAKVLLGRHLFYDVRLSGNGTFSCANCHLQSRAFADPLPRGVGSTGEVHPRGAMSLANVAFASALTWGNPNMRTLEAQALVPMFGEDPVELGLAGKETEMLARLGKDARYRRMFADAFPGEPAPLTLVNVTRAIASFERVLISGRSPYDRAQHGERAAMSAAAQRGEQLFFSERLECFHCHGGYAFTGTVNDMGKAFPEVEFHNTGLYNIGGRGGFPRENPGLMDFTQRKEDEGKFKAPTLRNIALTAPYMHDGSIATLDGVIDHYAAGGRTIVSGPHAGDGSTNPNKSEFINGFELTAGERQDLLAFLHSLTDSAFVTDPRFADPWPDTLRGRGVPAVPIDPHFAIFLPRAPRPSTPGPHMTRSLRSFRLPLAALAIALLAAAATPAERFHTRLVKSNPAKDAVVATAPAALELWFSEKIDLAASRVQLVGPGGTAVTTAALTRDDAATDAPVVVRITGPVVDGVQTVNWSAASGDGHPVKGSFTFTVKKP